MTPNAGQGLIARQHGFWTTQQGRAVGHLPVALPMSSRTAQLRIGIIMLHATKHEPDPEHRPKTAPFRPVRPPLVVPNQM